jgi:hypothetical protein
MSCYVSFDSLNNLINLIDYLFIIHLISLISHLPLWSLDFSLDTTFSNDLSFVQSSSRMSCPSFHCHFSLSEELIEIRANLLIVLVTYSSS